MLIKDLLREMSLLALATTHISRASCLIQSPLPGVMHQPCIPALGLFPTHPPPGQGIWGPNYLLSVARNQHKVREGSQPLPQGMGQPGLKFPTSSRPTHFLHHSPTEIPSHGPGFSTLSNMKFLQLSSEQKLPGSLPQGNLRGDADH